MKTYNKSNYKVVKCIFYIIYFWAIYHSIVNLGGMNTLAIVMIVNISLVFAKEDIIDKLD